MNIYVPFTQLRAETFIELARGATFLPLLTPFQYSHHFMQRWAEGESFINVEHDVVPTQDQLVELWDCPFHWCVFGYTPTDASPYLGCAKFSSVFIASHPDLWVERQWGNCDVYLADRAKIPVHYHRGSCVRHIK